MDDLDDHLAGGDGLHHLLADGTRTHLVDERAHDIERHVRLDQRTAHLAQSEIDIGLRQRAAPRQLVEYAAEAVGQALEHAVSVGRTGDRPLARSGRTANAKRTRGRKSLAGGDLRDQVPVGVSASAEAGCAVSLGFNRGGVKADGVRRQVPSGATTRSKVVMASRKGFMCGIRASHREAA